MSHNPGPTALYRLFGAKSDLLYIGIAADPEERWKQHKRTKPWASMVAKRDNTWFKTRSAAEAAETLAIRAERPRYNIRDTPKMFPNRYVAAPLMQRHCGTAEIGMAFGVNRQRVQQLVARPDFPVPESILAMGKVWRTEDVRRWGIATGRLKAGPKNAED
jgi:predicted GIY-YIG superfamily endonuclease